MSRKSRDELLASVSPQYLEAKRRGKKVLLDNFVLATGYGRKYAVRLLSEGRNGIPRKGRGKKYDDKVLEALLMLWNVANQICSKRLVPFLPSLIESLEKCGHLELSAEVKEKLLSLSAATVDRLLKKERQKSGRGKSTTHAGALLKKHIPISTFADWNNVKPGFFEADLVAHCGLSTRGQYLNTLTMTDIATGWTELAVPVTKTGADVLIAITDIKTLLPFPMLGFDSDNGGEFINHNLVDWCAKHQITFTRSREYRKNDQAHVEEKNGSIVRRMIGYNRYEGNQSWQILCALYRHLRLYVNFFQPSVKLTSKTRDGARVSKKYDKALTPYERVLQSKFIARHMKTRLRRKFENLDPLFLIKQIQTLQAELAATAVKNNQSEIRSLAFSTSESPETSEASRIETISTPSTAA